MMNQIAKDVTEIKVSLGRIDEHLKSINGTIQRHEEDIDNMKMLVYKAAGVLMVITIIANYVLGKI